MRLLTVVGVGSRESRNRVMFGPHVTNLGVPGPDSRALSAAHVAYYERRARGGAGVVVTETASVHPSDWPYERAPEAERCGPGWTAVANAVQAAGALAIASLGHAGLQGSSAYHQRALWAPSRFPDAATREVPMAMEVEEIAELVESFGRAATIAARSGLDGVEIEAGQHSLLRQFLSGLTNTRTDEYGADRTRFVREVLAVCRAAMGPDRIVGLRLSCDESAPWAGITPEASGDLAVALTDDVDYVVAVRAGPFDAGGTRPDPHVEPGFALDLAARLREALPSRVRVVAQGSIVNVGMAESACDYADFVEMTRAQIAEPDLVAKLADPGLGAPRPCVRCNQTCQVRDARNPIVTCIGEPRSGYETTDPDPAGQSSRTRDVLVVGAGPAGLEAARVAAGRGHRVVVRDAVDVTGGAVNAAAQAPGRESLRALTDWLANECRRLGVTIELGHQVADAELTAAIGRGTAVIVATGSTPGAPGWRQDVTVEVCTARQALQAPDALPDGPVLIDDPVGGPIGVSVAELLASRGREVTFVSQDPVIGTQLSRTGDLAPANARLARAGVAIHKRSLLRGVDAGGAVIEDRYTGASETIPAAVVIDAGPLMPWNPFADLTDIADLAVVGDAVAPRTIAEAILEGRRAALAVDL